MATFIDFAKGVGLLISLLLIVWLYLTLRDYSPKLIKWVDGGCLMYIAILSAIGLIGGLILLFS